LPTSEILVVERGVERLHDSVAVKVQDVHVVGLASPRVLLFVYWAFGKRQEVLSRSL